MGRGSIVYTDKFKGDDSLIFCEFRHLKMDHGKRFARGKVNINGLEGFWSYAKKGLIKFHSGSKQNLPLYLKALEFRCNHRKDENIIQTIVNYLTIPVADFL